MSLKGCKYVLYKAQRDDRMYCHEPKRNHVCIDDESEGIHTTTIATALHAEDTDLGILPYHVEVVGNLDDTCKPTSK